MPEISQDLLPRARQILLPLVTTTDERDALLTEAFYLHDPLLYGIEREGAPYPFAVKCLKKLLDYGCLPEQEHSLARLLAIARTLCGTDKHSEIDALIQITNEYCRAAEHPTRPTIALTPPETPAPLQTIETPRTQRRPTVFLSYSHTDAEFAHRLIDDLRAAGHACWIDTSSLKGGDEWITTIAEGILNSYCVVVVATRAALLSRWVQDEIVWARKKNKPLIPVLLEDVVEETGFFPLARYQAETFFGVEYDGALAKLLRALPSPLLPESGEAAPVAEEDCPPPTSVKTGVPRNLPRTLELAYLERLRLEELLNTEKYTPLAGASQQKAKRAEMRAVFELMCFGENRKAMQETRRFENAVEEIRLIRRAVLLGEPGGGKTTTIWKLASELVADAIHDPKAPIPLLIRLGRWTDAEQGLPEFIASQLGELGAHLDELLAARRAALLLDGLNELPTGQRGQKYPLVQDFIERHPRLLAVVSCRELDYTVDLGFDRINITPLDPLRIREFVGRYLNTETEPEKGEELFWRLAGGEDVRGVWEKWKEAEADFDLFWTASEIPKENPNVFGITSGEHDRIWREKVRGRHSLMELSRNPYMLLMLTSVYAEQGALPENRGGLFRLFVETLLKRERIPAEEQAPLTAGLAKVAYEMQIRRADDQIGEQGGDALTVLDKAEVARMLSERQLYLAGSAGILSIGEQVRFTHQLLQEYFAAKFMDIEIEAGRLKATKIWEPENWWNRTNWEEAAILLAGLYSDDCSKVVEWIAEANPEIAAQCAVRSGAGLAEATKERLRAKWIPRLTDLNRDPNPKARAAVGRAVGLIGGDNRKGVGIIVRNGLKLPDFDWVRILEGEFQYGDDKDEYAAKPQKLRLPEFYISRFPVTFSQFQCFVEDPEGVNQSRWFEGLTDDDDDRRMDEQRFKFDNHPRDTVSWYQAMAFCRWLSWRLGTTFDLKKVAEWAVRLPTEFEWEKAARGTDGRLYPYGNDFDAAKGNTGEDESDIGQTSAVGIFPNGASPYGVEEMSGNVWEWCLSDYDKPQVDARKENLRKAKYRVLRGGSWFVNRLDARAVCRYVDRPANRDYFPGFRLVVLRPPS